MSQSTTYTAPAAKRKAESHSHEKSTDSSTSPETTHNSQPQRSGQHHESVASTHEPERRSTHSKEGNHRVRSSITIVGIEPLMALTQLEQGDGLLWADRSQPLLVTETPRDSNSSVSLEGPLGGEYVLQHYDDAFVVLSKYGRISDPVRVKTISTPPDESYSKGGRRTSKQGCIGDREHV